MIEIVGSHSVDLTPAEATAWIERELAQASESLHNADLDAALDSYVRAVGLALQLGPAPAEQAVAAVLQAARHLAGRPDSAALSTLAPALVDLVARVRAAGVLPPTAAMDAWATVASDLGALLGQIGLALSIPPGHGTSLLDTARAHATLLDEVTGGLFALTAWLDELQPAP